MKTIEKAKGSGNLLASRPKALIGKKGKPGNGTDRHAVANYELKMLRAAFNFVMNKKKLISSNPTAGVEFLPRTEKCKRYVPPADDIVKLLDAAREPEKAKSKKAKEAAIVNSLIIYSYLLVLIFTLARVGEVNKLEWLEVNSSRRFLTLIRGRRKAGISPEDRFQ